MRLASKMDRKRNKPPKSTKLTPEQAKLDLTGDAPVIEQGAGEPSGGQEAKHGRRMKALMFTRDPALVVTLSQLFDELFVETHDCSLASDVMNKLSSEKFDALVLDFDNDSGCTTILRSAPETRPNQNVVVMAVGSGEQVKQTSALDDPLVIERPLVPRQIRNLLRTAYGRMLRNSQVYFRLTVELPVSIRTATGMMLQCTTINLSQRGMAVLMFSSCTVGQKLDIAFAIPNTDLLMSAEATIIWDDKHGKAGMSFECASPAVEARFCEWLYGHFVVRLAGEGRDY
jgi:PilZ domain